MQYIWLIIAHFIADFLCQSRKMGVNKSSSIYWLSIHIIAYTSVLTACAFGAWYFYEVPVSATKIIIFSLTNGYLHLFTDFITSRVSAYFYKKEKLGFFWWTIGFDQMIHAICLLYTYDQLLLNAV